MKPHIDGQEVGFMILDTGAQHLFVGRKAIVSPASLLTAAGCAMWTYVETFCTRLCAALTVGAASLLRWTAGASGLVIERAAADRLRLPCIGEIHVSGVAGKTRSCFRRSSSIQVTNFFVIHSGGFCHEGQQ